jgi:hypothetical protein
VPDGTVAVPINPFMVLGYFLYDLVDRDAVRLANNNLILRCDELWVFGEPADGVAVEIRLAGDLGLPVRRFTLDHYGDEILEVNKVTSNPEQLVPLELAERLAGAYGAFGEEEPPRARVFPNALPPGLPVDLPLPPGARLLGSRLAKSPLGLQEAGRGVRAEEDVADIYLDVPTDAAGVFAFY